MPSFSGWIKWPGEGTYHDYPVDEDRERLVAILEAELKQYYGDFLRTDQEHFSEYWDKTDPTLLIGTISVNYSELEWAEHYFDRMVTLQARAQDDLERVTRLVDSARARLDEIKARA